MVNYFKRIIIVRGTDLCEFCFVDVRLQNVCFCFTSNEKIATFLRKYGDFPKWVVDFLRERGTFRNKRMEIVVDLACEAKFLHFFIVHHFSSFFSFFHVFNFSFLFSFCFFIFSVFFPFFFSFVFSFFLFLFFLSGAQFFLVSISLRLLFTVL